MKRTTRIRLAAAASAGMVCLGLTAGTTTGAQAFGTVDGKIGQNAEHEKITRVLGTAATDGVKKRDLQARTLDELAGKSGTLGAVGAPDNLIDSSVVPVVGLGPGKKHCDGADYLDIPGYPQSRKEADADLDRCIDYYSDLLERAVKYSGQLVGTDLDLNNREARIDDCDYGWKVSNSQPAKCEVLNAFGRSLHLAEDFWSHTNWADESAAGPVSITNPPGLNRTAIPDFFQYPTPKNYNLPDRLVSGCDDSIPLSGCGTRIGHSALAKDNGKINPNNGDSSPTDKYPRSLTSNNFSQAVRGARRQVKSTWNELQDAIESKYGAARGREIIRAITNDAPWTDCNTVGGSARMATRPPVGKTRSNRSVAVTLLNRSDSTINCTRAILNDGEWSNLPESPVNDGRRSGWRTQSNGGGVSGSVQYRIGKAGPADEVVIKWENPLIGSNSYDCKVPKGYNCTRSGGSGNQSEPTFTVTRG